jgi:transcriptional regulator GlxA family with amidase domain
MATTFFFLVLPQVHLLDLAGPNQVVGEAIDLGADFKIEYCGIESETNTSAALGIRDLKHFSKVRPKTGDYIIIPGSRVRYLQSQEFKSNTPLFQWLTSLHQKQVLLVSICVGAFVLAEAGLLNDRECTTHFRLTEQLQKRFPACIVRENILFTHEHNIYTSAGIASGIDLMLHIIEKQTDGYFAHKIARELVVYKRREGVHEQQSIYFQHRDHIHSGIHKVQDFIIDNIAQKLYLHELAEVASMSERNFSRLFKRETGATVHEYITRVRIEQVKTLVKNPDLSRKQIAKKVGLESEKQIARLLLANG